MAEALIFAYEEFFVILPRFVSLPGATAYSIFCKEHRATLKDDFPGLSFGEVTRAANLEIILEARSTKNRWACVIKNGRNAPRFCVRLRILCARLATISKMSLIFSKCPPHRSAPTYSYYFSLTVSISNMGGHVYIKVVGTLRDFLSALTLHMLVSL